MGRLKEMGVYVDDDGKVRAFFSCNAGDTRYHTCTTASRRRAVRVMTRIARKYPSEWKIYPWITNLGITLSWIDKGEAL